MTPDILNGLPEGTTHVGCADVTIQSGGRVCIDLRAFKYDKDGTLKMYRTDNDNEYPQWWDAKFSFKELPSVYPVEEMLA